MSFLPFYHGTSDHAAGDESVAQLYIDGSPFIDTCAILIPVLFYVNKNLVIAYLTIFMQGTA